MAVEAGVEISRADFWDELDNDTSEIPDSIGLYYREIGRVALLTAEQEVELAKRIEAGLMAGMILAAADPERSAEERADGRDQLVRTMHHGPKPKIVGPVMDRWYRQEVTAGQVAALDALLVRQASTAEQIADLKLVEADGEEARQDFIDANLRLVVPIAKSRTGRGVAFLDLIQEGNLGLDRAVKKFDYAKGYKFSTYATPWIKQFMDRGRAMAARVIELPVHVYEEVEKVRKTVTGLRQSLEREPTPREIAAETNYTEARVVELLGWADDADTLDRTIGASDQFESSRTLGESIEDLDQVGPEGYSVFRLDSEDLRRAVAMMPEHIGSLLTVRYGLEDGQFRSLEQAARVLGFSSTHAKRLERRGLDLLRQHQGLRDMHDGVAS